MTVTLETAVRRAYLPALRQSGKLGEIIAMQAEAVNREYDNEEKIGKTCKGLPSDTLNFQHDPLCCAVALGWNEGVKIKEIPLWFEIKAGELKETVDNSGKFTRVVTEIDGEKFNKFWFHLLTAR